MNLLLAIFYSNYQERVSTSIENFKQQRNDYLIYLYRNNCAENGNGKVDKAGTRGILQEIHSLVLGHDEKGNELETEMSELQFEQIFKLLKKESPEQDGEDEVDPDHMHPCEMITLLQAYETWVYEKQYKAAMEDLYSSNKNVEQVNDRDQSFDTRALKLLSSP